MLYELTHISLWSLTVNLTQLSTRLNSISSTKMILPSKDLLFSFFVFCFLVKDGGKPMAFLMGHDSWLPWPPWVIQWSSHIRWELSLEAPIWMLQWRIYFASFGCFMKHPKGHGSPDPLLLKRNERKRREVEGERSNKLPLYYLFCLN